MRPILEPLVARGLSYGEIAVELNRRHIRTRLGNLWSGSTVRIMWLTGETGAKPARGGTKRDASKAHAAITARAAARRAELAPTIHRMLDSGMSIQEIVEAFKLAQVPTARGGKWHRITVLRLIRLE